MNLQTLCREFSWVGPTADADGHIVTPWRYDDGDRVVVFVSRESDRWWRLDDNGDALFRLAAAGVDPESTRLQARLAVLPQLLGVRVDEDGEQLVAFADDANLEAGVLAVAEAAAQLQGLAIEPRSRVASVFREQVVALIEAVARDAKIETHRNVPADESQSILADLYLCSKTPIAVFAATSAHRLMEAQMTWLDAQRRAVSLYVLATVESARAVGISQYTRANYYTDKTVEFTEPGALKGLIATQMLH